MASGTISVGMQIERTIVACPHCSHMAFAAYGRVARAESLLVVDTKGKPVEPKWDLLQIECCWCRTVYHPLGGGGWRAIVCGLAESPSVRERLALAVPKPEVTDGSAASTG